MQHTSVLASPFGFPGVCVSVKIYVKEREERDGKCECVSVSCVYVIDTKTITGQPLFKITLEKTK